MMKKVASVIDLKALNIQVNTTRRTRAGGVLLEVEGLDKATLLAEKVRTVVGDQARVRLPENLTPVLILGLPEWSDAEEVSEGLVKAGIPGEMVTRDGKSLVTITQNAGGRREFVGRINLPYAEAIMLTDAGALRVGWTVCRTKSLEKEKPTCFRCQQIGHLAAECRNPAKARQCHGCGSKEHLVRDCRRQQEERAEGGEQPQGSEATGPSGTPPTEQREEPPIPPETGRLDQRSGPSTSAASPQ